MMRVRAHRSFTAVALAGLAASAVALGLTGCFTFTPQVDLLADQIEQDLPGTRLQRRGGVKAGRISLGLARSIARMTIDKEEEPEAEAALGMLSGIKRVEFRRFERSPTQGGEANLSRVDLERRLGRRGWTTLARVVGDDSLAWVLVRFDDRHVRSAVVVVLDDEELNLMRVSGRLDRVLVEALRFARSQVEDDGDDEDDWLFEPGDGADHDEAPAEPATALLTATAEALGG